MRKLITNPIAIAITLIVISYVSIVKWYLTKSDTSPAPISWSVSVPNDDTSFAGIFYSPSINDSLPHYLYKKINDSIEGIKTKREQYNRSLYTGSKIGILGMAYIDEDDFTERNKIAINDPRSLKMIDSITSFYNTQQFKESNDDYKKKKDTAADILWRYNVHINKLLDSLTKTGNKSYYITISGYSSDHYTKFFIDKGKYNLAYVVYDRVRRGTYDSTLMGHYQRKEIKIRYSKEDNQIFFPVSKSWYSGLSFVLILVQWLTIAVMAFFTIGLPVQIIIAISKGQAFTQKNVYRLRILSFAFIIYGVIKIGTPFIVHLLIRNQIPEEIILMSGFMTIIDNLIYFFIAAIVFILSLAFKNGLKLQQEQNLII